MDPTLSPDTVSDMARRRAAGERVSSLAAELGITRQRLEKLTRHAEGSPLPTDPARVRQELRWARLMLAAVPSLGCNKPWAVAWRERICGRLRRRVARLRRHLAALIPPSQLPATMQRPWRPRPATAADARISRQYDPKATNCLWGEL